LILFKIYEYDCKSVKKSAMITKVFPNNLFLGGCGDLPL